MKKVLLTITAAALSLALSAQTSHNIEFDDLSGTCPIDNNITTTSIAYTINGIIDGSASISTSGDQLGWHNAKFFFKDALCADKSIDLSNPANRKVRIKLNATATVASFMFSLTDKNGNTNDGVGSADPDVKAVVIGDNTIEFTIPNVRFGTNYSTTPFSQVTFDSTNVASISFAFRNAWCDNDNVSKAGAPDYCDGFAGSVAGTFLIDYIRVGSDLENGILEDAIALNKTVSALYNLQGQAVSADYQGLVIVKYSDGTVSKIFQ